MQKPQTTPGCCPDPAAVAVAVSALAAAISQGKSQEELNLLSVVFSQLGDTLATIAVMEARCADQAAPPVIQ